MAIPRRRPDAHVNTGRDPLPVVVGLSFAARIGLDHETSLPRVFVDELIYSGVAKSLAMGDGFSLRGVPVGLDYGFLVPGSLGLVYALTRTGASAYHAIQALNALAMSLAAVPAYYLARRILAPGWSLVVACLTVATPAMAYAPRVMTEAFFYPIFVTATLALTLAVEQPTWRRQALAIALILVAASTRVQGLVLIPSLATAVVLEGASARRSLESSLRRFTPSWVLLAAVGAAALVATRGHPAASLGTYADLVRRYSIVDAAKWFVWNLAALELSLGIVALAALLVALPLLLAQNAPGRRARIRGRDDRRRLLDDDVRGGALREPVWARSPPLEEPVRGDPGRARMLRLVARVRATTAPGRRALRRGHRAGAAFAHAASTGDRSLRRRLTVDAPVG